MLTEADRTLQAETGLIPPERLCALIHALRCKATDLKQRAVNAQDGGGDERYVAALQGMAASYRDSARQAERILAGMALRPHPQSAARQKSRSAVSKRTAKQGDGR